MNYGEQKSGGSSSDAVAPVIAGILLVAMTVLMAAVVGVVVMSMANAESVPILSIKIDANTNTDTLTITHMAGATLSPGTYLIRVNGIDQTSHFFSDGKPITFQPGTALSWKYGKGFGVRHVAVIFIGEHTEFLLAQKTFDTIVSSPDIASFTMAAQGKQTGEVWTDTDTRWPAIPYFAHRANLTAGSPLTVSFTADAMDTNLEYAWSFGNGKTDTGKTPASQTYDSSGTYTISLTVTNVTTGGSNSTSQTISVKKPGITAMTWVKISSNTNGKFWTNKYPGLSSQSDEGYQWLLQKQPMGFEFKVKTSSGVSPFYYYPDNQIQRNSWYHVAGLYDPSLTKSCVLYINGTPNTSSYQNTYPQDPLVTAPFSPMKYSPTGIDLGSAWAFPWVEDCVPAVYDSEKMSYS